MASAKWVGFHVSQLDIAEPFVQQVQTVFTIWAKNETQESSIKSFRNGPVHQKLTMKDMARQNEDTIQRGGNVVTHFASKRPFLTSLILLKPNTS